MESLNETRSFRRARHRERSCCNKAIPSRAPVCRETRAALSAPRGLLCVKCLLKSALKHVFLESSRRYAETLPIVSVVKRQERERNSSECLVNFKCGQIETRQLESRDASRGIGLPTCAASRAGRDRRGVRPRRSLHAPRKWPAQRIRAARSASGKDRAELRLADGCD